MTKATTKTAVKTIAKTTAKKAASKAMKTATAKKAATKTATSAETPDASALITQRIADLGGWRGATLARMRALVRAADPAVVETWKWMGTPVWERDGIVCTGESYKEVVKLTFAHGAALADPAHLFNSSLDGNVRRAIDIREGETVDETAFTTLVRAAIAANTAALAARKTKK